MYSLLDAEAARVSLHPAAPNPTPTITTISPNSSVAGGAAFTLTINGTNFVAASMVNFGGSAPATTFVNSTQLTAAIPAASVASTGTLAVTVTNPAPGGGTSNSVNFTITSGLNPVPTISSFYPSCAPAGEQFVDSVDNQLEVIGLKFCGRFSRALERHRPADHSVIGSINVLIAQISASDIAAAGTAAVTVFNPAPGGGSSNSLTFTITPGAVDPQSIAVDPTGKFAYVANAGCDGGVGGYVSMYTINPTTGALASIGPPVSSQDDGTDSVTVDPFGKFAYVANSGMTLGQLWQRRDVHHQRHDRGLNVHRSDKRKLSGIVPSLVGGRGSIRQVRLCGEWGRYCSKQRLDVHHQRHDRGLNVHRNDRRRRLCRLGGRGSIGQVRLCGD